MKIITVLVCILYTCLGCQQSKNIKEGSQSDNGFTINGFINVSPTVNTLYLVDKNEVIIDSSKVLNQSFSLKGIVIEPSIYNLVFDGQTTSCPIILENNNFKVLINDYDTMILGGVLNNKLSTYQSITSSFKESKRLLLNRFSKENFDNKKKSTALDSITVAASNFNIGFIIENKDNLLATTIFETLEFPLDTLIRLAESTKDAKNTSFVTVLAVRITTLQQIEADRIALKEKEAALRRDTRAPAPMFSGESLSGSDLALQSILKGKKAILVDFWASWCKPCRMVTPQLRSYYKQYKDKGFDIITVSEDKNQSAWRNGIQQDQMTAWNHIYDDYMRIAGMYGVRAIPHMVLIDGNGKIIKNKISITQLRTELAKVFK